MEEKAPTKVVKHASAVKPVEEIKPEPIIEKESITIDQVILLENLPNQRILMPDGSFYRLELKSSGVYWLYPA